MPYKPPPSEPIAVVASSCRFTGGATSPSKLWDLLKQPSDLSRTVPLSRFNGQAFFNPDGDYHGTTNATKAYWLDDDQDVRKFDADFFDIAPKEAEAIDPQQRLLLETVFEALESASYQLPQWTGKDVAVYVGAMTADFDTISQRDDLSTSPYYATGNARSILSNRISYFYNFHGPSVTIDTACSSSLVALHQAIISLRAGDCSAACVAGVNVMLSPEQFVVESSLHMLSPTGHCHMWDRKADGYARGEGAAVLLLKPLSRALVDGDGCRIQAVIRETGVGSDGRTAGITMPNPGAQAALIRATYRRAGLDISDSDDRCQYFEAHGTGTPVGDPREARAIYTAFFGELNENAEINLPCSKKSPRMLVGSVKTVIGHTEGAAGLAGLLKVMLAMKESKVPPNLHLERLNPQVAPYCTPTAAQGYLHIPTQLTDWPQVAPGQPLRASVNSFGFGGTNAHAIVERYDPGIHSPHLSRYQSIITSPEVSNLPQIPLVLSAKSARSLRVLAQKYLDLFQLHENGDSTSDFQRVAWLTHSSKTMFMHRLAVCGQSRAEAIRILTEILSDASQYQAQSFGSRARRVESKLKDNKPRLLGVFTGQGAQWAGMSKHLFLASPVYRESIRYLDSVLEICPDPPVWTLEDELFKLETDGSRLSEAAIAQPVCTALQIGLVHVLRRLGVRFTCVIGHSSGEIAAAYAAKYISARDAILIAYYRGRSVSAKAVAQSLGDQQQSFGMLAVGMPYDKANEFCAAFGSHLCAAASNSPSSSTLSGDIEAIQEADRQLKASSIFCRRVLVDKAYHSHYMAQLSVSYHKALESCRLSPLERTAESSQQTTWISSVGPDRKTPTPKQLAGTYWVDNMVNPVLFREATEEALHQGDFDCVVEVGPHATLRGPFLDTVAQYQDTKKHKVESLPYTSLLQRGRNDAKSFLEFLGFALTQFDPPFVNLDGILDDGGKAQLAIDLSRMHSSDADKLPSYPWDHSQKFYRESRITRQFHFKNEPPHELLGSRTRDDVEGHEIRWRNILRVDKIPWLAHHTFQSQPLLPASAYCIMALDAAKALLAGREASLIELEDVEFIRGVPLEVEGPATEIMFSLFVEHQPGGLHTEEDKKDFIRCSFSLYSGSESSSTCLQKCCTGRIHIVLGSPSTNALPRRVPPGEQPEAPSVSTDAFYDMMTNVGLHYTGPFRSIETMHRRHNFATASLRRFHETDSTRLSWSPAALDSCLQTCFVSYASPGDGALWTVFLPILMKRVSFNMACGSRSGRLGLPQGSRLSVDAQVIEVRQATSNTPARIEGDILIYNDAGDMEVCVEGLTVGSLVPSDADIDRELYLYTKYAPDPEVALVQNCAILDGTDATRGIRDNVLEESIQRVQAFYKLNPEWASIWPAETEKSLDHHILTSRYSSFLEQVRAYIKGSTGEPKNALVAHDELSPLQSLIEEGRHSFKFKHHTASIVKQIAHKYPHMSVISLTDSTMGMSATVLDGLGSAFTSYASVVLGAPEKDFDKTLAHLPKAIKRRVSRLTITQFDDTKTRLDEFFKSVSQPCDLAILSTSVFGQAKSSDAVLGRVKSIMRPGGILILVHMPIKMTRDRDQQTSHLVRSILTPPDWPDLLDQHGFINPAIKNTDQHYPGGFSLTVRRSASLPKQPAHLDWSSSLFSAPTFAKAKNRLLIVGGQTAAISTLAAHINDLLSKHFNHSPILFAGLDELYGIDPKRLLYFNNIILLSDLDENHPVLSSLNERGLETLRKVILRPEATILWVTKGSRVGNAENAASYGFTRSIRAEMPSLVLQMLDFDFLDIIGDQLMISCEPSNTSPSAAFFISDAFLQLMLAAEKTREQKFYSALHSQIKQPADHMWVLENEVFIDSTGQRLVPRMLPFEPSNDNFNALRRVVAQKQNTLSSCIELLFDTTHNTYQAVPRPFPVPKVLTGKPSPKIDASEPVHIQVLYSSTVPLFHGLYVIIGRCVESENLILSASKTNSSFVSVPKKMLLPIENDLEKVNIRACAAILVRTLFYAEIQRRFGSKKVVLIAPEGMLHQSVEQLSYAKGSIAIIQVSSDAHKACSPLVIHPRDTASQMALKLMRFGDEATFISFLPTKHPVLRRLSSLTPVIDASQLWGALFAEKRQHIQEVNCSDLDNLQQAWVTAKRVPEFGLGDDRCIDIVSVPTLLKSPGNISPSLKLVDWQAERMVECKVLSHGAIEDVAREAARPATQIRGDRTYVFIGITRDMGQSLATLLIKQGALYIVLASRSTVIVEPQWAKRARNMLGVDVQFEVLDVTDLAAVEQFRARVEKRMPRIGGIVNGAMVLQDQVFAQMTAETFSRVMRPKTVGSRNLDTVFHDDEEEDDNKLDFFIMMSSFAAVGGHAGQSNYSAANMYMNGIAADRQRRGVAGFALNIGVIYGLGFLHREKGNLYAGLEREGYPPISERDLHHMFLEAIAYGRPKANQTTHNQAITDLTAGLSRFNPQQAPEDALHWHKDPRFSHFTIDDDASKSNGRPGGKAASEKIHSSLKRLLDVINEETSTADAISLLLVTALSERLARLLHLDPAQGSDTADNSSSNGRHIRSDSSMVELGVDSLVAVQVRTWLWRTTGRDVSVMKVLGAPSIDILCHDIAGEIVAGRVKTK